MMMASRSEAMTATTVASSLCRTALEVFRVAVGS
jgi:hypothetical protein